MTEWNHSPFWSDGGQGLSAGRRTFGRNLRQTCRSGRADISFACSGRSERTRIPIRSGHELTLGHQYDECSAPAGFPPSLASRRYRPPRGPLLQQGAQLFRGFLQPGNNPKTSRSNHRLVFHSQPICRPTAPLRMNNFPPMVGTALPWPPVVPDDSGERETWFQRSADGRHPRRELVGTPSSHVRLP